MQKDDPFVMTFKNNLSKEFCQKLIDQYEEDKLGQYPGVTFKGFDPSTKRTTDMFISSRQNWSQYDQIIYKSLHEAIKEYLQKIPQEYRFKDLWHKAYDRGYQIQKYNKNDGFYVWHNDYDVDPKGNFRILTFLWYLNDVEEGGETEFINGQKIKPEAGKLLLFPSTWMARHRGSVPISNNKYIMTGWIYASYPNDTRYSPKTQEEVETDNINKKTLCINRVTKRKRENEETYIEETNDNKNLFSLENK